MSNDVRIPSSPSTEVAPPSETRPPSVSAALAGLLMPILALVAAAALIGAGFWAWSRWVEPETIETTTATFTDPIQRIEVTSDSGSIEVVAGGEDVRLERISRFRSNRPSVTEEVVDEVLHIEVQCPSELFFSSCSVDYQITAPASVELIVDSGNGDLNALGMIGGVNLATSSGLIDVEGVAGETSLETGSGDIRGRGLDVPAHRQHQFRFDPDRGRCRRGIVGDWLGRHPRSGPHRLVPHRYCQLRLDRGGGRRRRDLLGDRLG